MVNIRLYNEKTDFNKVEILLRRNGFQDISHEHFRGLALVAEHGDELVGFVWALIGDSDIAYCDYLVCERIEGDTMKPNLVSCLLVPTLFQKLLELGIKSFKVFTLDQDRFSDEQYLNKLYTRYGVDCLGKQYVYSGQNAKILYKIRELLPKERSDGEELLKSSIC